MHLVKHRILQLLAENGPLTREGLADLLDSPPDVHPGQLRRQGLIDGNGSAEHPYQITEAGAKA